MSPSFDDAPDLSGLIELSRLDNLDLKPVILRVQTDLFLSASVRDRKTMSSFASLAGGLIPIVDDETAEAVARKLAVLCWHMLTKGQDYLWARPSLVAQKRRAMELQAGRPQRKGNVRGPAYAYNVKALRDQEARIAERAEKGYERFVAAWHRHPPRDRSIPQRDRTT